MIAVRGFVLVLGGLTHIHEATAQDMTVESPTSFEVIAGQGILARLDGCEIAFGNRRLMETCTIALDDGLANCAEKLEHAGKTVMFLAVLQHPPDPDKLHREREEAPRLGEVSGLIAVADVVRDQVPAALRQLRALGTRKLVLLTGDNARVASALAQQLGVEFHAEMLPEDKIEFVRKLQRAGHRVAMVGDGINDAPALAQVEVGIAMGVAGTDVSMEAAHIALMTDDWSQIPVAVRLARRAFRTIRQNITFGLLSNIAGLTLASLGILTPVMAAAAQSLPDVVVFLNSSRLLRD